MALVFQEGLPSLKPSHLKRAYLLVVLVGIVFLAAQMHCCLELNSRTLDSHFCPICSTAGSAIATPSPIIILVPTINRFEVTGVSASVPIVVFRNVAPRAPPLS